MRLSRIRVTVRGLMIAVAVAAMLLVRPMTELLRRRLEQLAYDHSHASGTELHQASMTTPQQRAGWGQDAEARRMHLSPERFRWHVELAAKYWEAARSPWLPVAPDPPEPE